MRTFVWNAKQVLTITFHMRKMKQPKLKSIYADYKVRNPISLSKMIFLLQRLQPKFMNVKQFNMYFFQF